MSLKSHDKGLKFLLSQDPHGFLHFGLRPQHLRVLRPVESDLPARDRIIDGSYLVDRDGQRQVGHVEFFRMHTGLLDLALDIGEAQVRLHRKERVPVYSLLWDLYGSRKAKVLEDREVGLGVKGDSACTRIVYRRVNLRGMGAEELLVSGPQVLWPLVPLTRDGAKIGKVVQAMEAIEGRRELSAALRADHLAVLRFLAESERVPVQVLQSYLSKEKMMESSLYREIFTDGEIKGKAEGEIKGEVKSKAETLVRILVARLGTVDPRVRQLIQTQAQDDPEVLSIWLEEAILATEATAARRLVRKIRAAARNA